jgi:hypothetical protein
VDGPVFAGPDVGVASGVDGGQGPPIEEAGDVVVDARYQVVGAAGGGEDRVVLPGGELGQYAG